MFHKNWILIFISQKCWNAIRCLWSNGVQYLTSQKCWNSDAERYHHFDTTMSAHKTSIYNMIRYIDNWQDYIHQVLAVMKMSIILLLTLCKCFYIDVLNSSLQYSFLHWKHLWPNHIEGKIVFNMENNVTRIYLDSDSTSDLNIQGILALMDYTISNNAASINVKLLKMRDCWGTSILGHEHTGAPAYWGTSISGHQHTRAPEYWGITSLTFCKWWIHSSMCKY
jgi:hypothetical protein